MLGKTNVKVKPNKKVNYVEYLESTGTQYIDTGIKPTQNTRVEIKFLQTVENKFLYGSRTSSSSADKHCFCHNSTTDMFPQFYNFSSAITASYLFNTIYTLKNGKDGFYLNDTLLKTYTYSNFTSTLNMYLFGLNQNGSLEARTFVGKIYYCKIYENDVLVRDFKPCKDGAGVYCLYDEVDKRYYYNQGSNDFVGPGYSIDVPENTKLLMKFENNLNDEVVKNTASMSTGEATYVGGKFNKAITLDGSAYVSIPLTDELTLGTNDFTIAGWFKFEGTLGNNCLFSQNYQYSSTYYWQGLAVWRSDGYSGLCFCCDTTASSSKKRVNTAVDVKIDKWYHVALVRYNGTVTLYLDGVSIGSLTASTVYQNTNATWKIGSSSLTSSAPTIREAFKGQVDEFIIINGTALWTANFTPPTHEYGGLIQ